jgi:hypothetical protein
LRELSKDRLIELLFMQIRNIWSEDGLYFLEIERKFGLETAVEIDKNVWAVMGKLEAQRLKKVMDISADGISGLFEALKHTSWWLDLENKEFNLEENRAMIRNRDCRVHKRRKEKGLPEFDCKSVRWGFLKNFVREFSPNIEVDCHLCPLDPHPADIWCEWEFIIK